MSRIALNADAGPDVQAVGGEDLPPSSATQAAPAAALNTPANVHAERLRFTRDGGAFEGRLFPATSGDAAVLWVFGSGGGLGGPAGGIYPRLGAALALRGVASLELDYRRPGDVAACVDDVACGIAHLEQLGRRRIVLVGHSLGGRVVIEAAARHASVIAVAAMSSVDAPEGAVEALETRPLLLVHGEADDVTPAENARRLFRRAHDPQLLLYPNCAHGLDQCGNALDRDLAAWIGSVLELPV